MALDRTWVNGLVDDDGSNTVGEVWNKADVVHIYDDVDKQLHYCELARITPQLVSPNTWSALYWDYQVSDPHGMLTPPSSAVIPRVAGWYLVTALVQWAPGTGNRGLALYLTNSLDGGEMWHPALNLTIAGVGLTRGLTQTLTRVVPSGPTGTIDIRVYHDVPAANQTVEQYGTRLAIRRVS